MKTFLSLMLACLFLASFSFAQRRRDPLTDAEIEKLRDAAQEPDKRINLMVKFAKERMLAIEQLRNDPKPAADRGRHIHDMLEDFMNLIDEIDDNVDDYSSKQEDFRKALRELIESDTEFQIRLRAFKDAAKNNSGSAEEARAYEFVLDSTLDAVKNSAENARKTLQEQNEEFQKKKK